MLASLSIENFALIDKLEISFQSGFSTITGETGAGKSILLGALGLALGNRADFSALKDKERKCIIEAVFKIADYDLRPWFAEADLDYEDETIIRREIHPGGKSRAFVNDSPVNLQQLQQLGQFLIDIHSQHETRSLGEEQYQFQILDAVAQTNALLNEYRMILKDYRADQKQLDALRDRQAAAAREQDFTAFLLSELLNADLRAGEIEILEEEISELSNVTTLRELFQKAIALAESEESGLQKSLVDLKQTFQRIAALTPKNEEISNRISVLAVEFDDIYQEIQQAADSIVADPNRLEQLQERYQMLTNLLKKHQAATIEELISIRNQLDEKVVSNSEIEFSIANLEKVLQEKQLQLDEKASRLHDMRLKAIPDLAARLQSILAMLGMPHAKIELQLQKTHSYNSLGNSALEFKFTANKGTAAGLIHKVASGGEMSRIMLAVKSVLAQFQNLPTIIFDEIDTGVSGEIAASMGEIMAGMGERMQVIAITHLPQIAARGQSQYKVHKVVQDGTTVSTISRLEADERVAEIARMLSGAAVSESAVAHAKALLN